MTQRGDYFYNASYKMRFVSLYSLSYPFWYSCLVELNRQYNKVAFFRSSTYRKYINLVSVLVFWYIILKLSFYYLISKFCLSHFCIIVYVVTYLVIRAISMMKCHEAWYHFLIHLPNGWFTQKTFMSLNTLLLEYFMATTFIENIYVHMIWQRSLYSLFLSDCKTSI